MIETLPHIFFSTEKIPNELKERQQWICWRYEERDGKLVKVPLAPWTTGHNGPASVTDPNNMASFDVAVEYATKNNWGIGFCFFSGDSFSGIDLDKLNEFEEAQEIIKKANSYTEYSPSGKGIHIIVKGKIGKAIKKDRIEVYSKDRFFTVTGNHVEDTPLTVNDAQELLDELEAKYGEGRQLTTTQTNKAGFVNKYGWSLNDLRIRDRKLDELLSTLQPVGYPSPSEADMATLSKLMFWGFSESGAVEILRHHRQREKLNRADYIERTLEKVSHPEKTIADYVDPSKWHPATGYKLQFETDTPTLEEEVRVLDHINDIEEPENLGKAVKVKGVIASNSTAYSVPKRISNGETVEIGTDDGELLRFINVSEDMKRGLLRKFLGTKEDVRVESSRVLYRIKITPPVQSLELLDGKVIDEKGREWKAREVFIVSDKQIEFEPGGVYEFIGKVVADPRNQLVTLLVWNARKADDVESIDQDKVRALMDFFKGKSVSTRVRWILDNFRAFSKIVRRENLALASLLAYFSPIHLVFDAILIRGWVIVAFVGDSTTGKSETVRSLLRLFNMGTLVTGETASTAGLTASAVQDKGGTWLVDWGFLVLMDLKLLAVDGFHKLSKEQSTALDESERTGQVIITKAGKNRAYARTRQIKIANPVERLGPFGTRSLSSFLYTAQAVPTIFNDTSIQRLDLIVLSDSRDVKPEDINVKMEDEVDPLLFNLKEALKLVWSNSLRVRFTEEAVETILKKATELTDTFGWSDAKVASIDMKYKLARLSSSLANLTLSFNDGLTETIVTKEHVEIVAEFLREEYSKAGFHILRQKELNEKLSPEEAREIVERIAEDVFRSKDEANRVKEIIEWLVERGRVTKDQLANKFHLADKGELRPLVSALQNEEVIERKNGFYPTQKAIQLAKAFTMIATFANPQKEPLGVSK